jgi:hypothetical protein
MKREIGLYTGWYIGGPDNYNGTEATVPTSIGLPEPGLWRLNAYINHKLFGSIYVKVDVETSATSN